MIIVEFIVEFILKSKELLVLIEEVKVVFEFKFEIFVVEENFLYVNFEIILVKVVVLVE